MQRPWSAPWSDWKVEKRVGEPTHKPGRALSTSGSNLRILDTRGIPYGAPLWHPTIRLFVHTHGDSPKPTGTKDTSGEFSEAAQVLQNGSKSVYTRSLKGPPGPRLPAAPLLGPHPHPVKLAPRHGFQEARQGPGWPAEASAGRRGCPGVGWLVSPGSQHTLWVWSPRRLGSSTPACLECCDCCLRGTHQISSLLRPCF